MSTIAETGPVSRPALLPGRALGIITIACTVLHAIPPSSFVGAILFILYLGGTMASQLRIASPLFAQTLLAIALGLALWRSAGKPAIEIVRPMNGASHA